MVEAPVDAAVCAALGVETPGAEAEAAAIAAHKPWQVLYAFADESVVAGLAPDPRALAAATPFAVIATAPGAEADFVSRFFAPRLGVDEDPVTGSAHCSLVPYWARRLGRTTLRARQISRRGGELDCELRGDRVRMTGRAVTFLQGEISIPG
jgi:predicted PhzF superfamily epimerase YddE/YHI9